jgi:transcription elongation factor S-II
LEQLKKIKNKDLFNELNNLISKYKKIIHSDNKNNSPEKSGDDFPKKYLIEEKKERDSSRNNARKNLYKYLEIGLKDNKEKEKLFETIVKIEEKLYEKYKCENTSDKKPELDESYTNRVLEILHNIKDDKNEEFRQKIVNGEISPEELSTMDENDMVNKSKRKEIQLKINNKINSLREDSQKITVEEGIYKCSKCGSRKTTQYEMQTRSADEPMTIFITCVTCGNSWRC